MEGTDEAWEQDLLSQEVPTGQGMRSVLGPPLGALGGLCADPELRPPRDQTEPDARGALLRCQEPGWPCHFTWYS